jgi:CheY-like chemotaxis protein/anti-sigma regulatory factor (Ser/Thr protein kinase)
MICRRDALSKGVTVETQLDPSLVAPRLIDPSRLRQIIGNLLANAVKFTERGGVHIRTRLVERPGETDQVAIEVTDTGVGIAPEDIARIFQPFEQVDASTRRRHGGMGIGLSVVRRLARHMGGDISLESIPGQGSTFTITLNAPPAGHIDIAGARQLSGEGEHTFSLMCVDDNPRNLIVIAALLRAAGHSVRECGSGEAALQAAASEPFDAILLDMVMPDMDGLDVLAHIQANPGPNQATPVIACTANVMPEQLKSYLAAGVADVVEKPIQAAVLLEAVNAVVHSNRRAIRLNA